VAALSSNTSVDVQCCVKQWLKWDLKLIHHSIGSQWTKFPVSKKERGENNNKNK
jgi:hypothetical protein